MTIHQVLNIYIISVIGVIVCIEAVTLSLSIKYLSLNTFLPPAELESQLKIKIYYAPKAIALLDTG